MSTLSRAAKRRQTGMATRLAAVIVLSAGMIYAVALTLNYLDSKAQIERNAKRNIRDAARAAIREIEKELGVIEAVTHQAAQALERLQFAPPELDQFLQASLEAIPAAYGFCAAFEPQAFLADHEHYAIYYYYSHGEMRRVAPTREQLDYFQRDWYRIPRSGGQPGWTDPYIGYTADNEQPIMTTYYHPFFKNTHEGRKLAGVVAADLTLVWLNAITQDQMLVELGTARLFSRSGAYLVHPDPDMLLTSSIREHARTIQSDELRRAAEQMQQGREGFTSVTGEETSGEESWLYHAPIAGTGWTLAIFSPKARLYEDLHTLTIKLAWTGCAFFLAFTLFAFTISRRFTRPITLMADVAQNLSEGRLGRVVSQLPELQRTADRLTTREYTRLAQSFAMMTGHLSALLPHVKGIARQVASSTAQIAEAAGQLRANGENNAAAATEVLASSRSISDNSTRLANHMMQLNDQARKASAIAETTAQSLLRIDEAQRDMVQATETFAEKTNLIREKTDGIGHMITTITQVANQTNLLSLNAAMEAEKAGEAGRGFAVVARQIRALADQTSVAVLHIAELVNGTHQAVREGVKTVDQTRTKARATSREFELLHRDIERLIEQTRAFDPELQSANIDMQAQSESARQIEEAIQQIQQMTVQVRDALGEFLHVTELLRSASEKLEQEMQHFEAG